MLCYDFHLTGYEVKDFGATIVLHLLCEYAGLPRIESHIEFTDVAVYEFIHTGGAIITDLDEVPVNEALEGRAKVMKERCRQMGGYRFWDDNPRKYAANLEHQGFRAWTIYSAIGFEGYVIAKDARPVD